MGVREKLLDFKRRLSDRKMYSIVVTIIAAVALWGFYQYKEAASFRQQLDNQYNRAFYDMAKYVENTEVLMLKSLICSTPAKTAATLQEAWHQSNLAQTNLGQLPVSQPVLANTSKFLTQVGDLAYSLDSQNLSGKPLSNKQYQTLEQLHGYATKLEESLNTLQSEISSGRMKWNELAQKSPSFFKKASTDLSTKQFQNVDNTFQGSPSLIYDGPFSDHIAAAVPKGISGKEVTPEQAKQAAIDAFGAEKIASITQTGKNDTSPIKTYSFKVDLKGAEKGQTTSIDITQKGGLISWMINNRPVPSATLSIDKAKQLGKAYLDKHGFPSMKDTYYLKNDNTATINYAYFQNNVIVYPDLIKVNIALDNGEIVGVESKGYLSSHASRTIPTPKISAKQAKASINPRVKVISDNLAIIPTDYNTEIFTHEFKGKLNNRDFLVYINAESGNEEKILMITDTPNGILTY